MKTSDYRKWIEAGYKNYGNDPWFFLRELAQNSRDAGASEIRVKTGRTPDNQEIIVFEDNGCGMTYDHALKYLFRLYASSKTGQKYSAGMFGIGFWTVFKFNPEKIFIESVSNNEKWGAAVDDKLETERIQCKLERQGTRITLTRPPMESSTEIFSKQVEKALVHYVSYLRRNNRNADPLPVYLGNKTINRPMKLPGPASLRFKKGAVQGVVGLGPHPKVYLYARGLPVWEGTTLEELSHTPTAGQKRKRTQQEMGQGLAPVFLLNGDDLEVNISRRRVIDNRALDRMRKSADKALSELVELAADSVSRRRPLRRWMRKIKRKWANLHKSFWKTVLISALFIIPLEYTLLKIFYKGPSGTTPAGRLSLRLDHQRYTGASVGPVNSRSQVRISYSPPKTTWFKLFHADEYHRETGFIQTFNQTAALPSPSLDCRRDPVTVTMQTHETGTLLLPTPVNYGVDGSSVRLEGETVFPVSNPTMDGAAFRVNGTGTLTYRCCPISPGGVLRTGQNRRLTRVPANFRLPDQLEQQLMGWRNWRVEKKVDTALRIIAALLTYDDSYDIARRYSNQPEGRDWHRMVLQVGAGDCDILNGMTILLLRRMDVPARLAVGLIGHEGKILPGMHAWTEYYNGGWHSVDATLYTSRSPGVAAAAVVPIPDSVNRRLDAPPVSFRDNETATTPPGTSGGTGPEIRSTGFPFNLSRNFLIIVAIAAAALSLGLITFLLMQQRKRKFNPFEAQDTGKVKENLAGMALHWLLHPHAWGDDLDIRYVKIIPTLKGEWISVDEAIKLSSKGKFYYIDKSSRLAVDLQDARIPVAAAGNYHYDPLIRVLPEAVSLNRIIRLKAVQPDDKIHGSLALLLRDVNRLLPGPCLVAPGLRDAEMFDVNLWALPPLDGAAIPNRFIAINPNSEPIRELVSLYQTNSQLAIFRLAKLIITTSSLVPGPPDKWLEKISRQLITELA